MTHQTVAYHAKGNIYLNITNRCSSDCTFCLAKFTDRVYGQTLKLEVEPEPADILRDLELSFLDGDAAEVVFVGLGEPTMRLEVVLKVIEWCRLRRLRTRLVTNGHGQLLNPGHHVAHELAAEGLNAVSVSLVGHNSEVYNQISRPIFSKAFREVIRFAEDCIREGIETELTIVDLPEVDIDSCRSIARKMGASLRVRPLITPDSEEVKA
ncbi:MAG: TatD family nuclease-associated radical SAM protein [Thermoleophilia bacterium]